MNWYSLYIKEAIDISQPKTVVRYTLPSGKGLLHRDSFNLDKLNDDEEMGLSELLNYVLQHPRDVPSGVLFTFTLEGEQNHFRLIELLAKAATGKVIRTEYIPTSKPIWTSGDGQEAYRITDLKSVRKAGLKDTLKNLPRNKGLTDFLASFGFDESGNEIPIKSKLSKEEQKRKNDEWREQEYEHMPA